MAKRFLGLVLMAMAFMACNTSSNVYKSEKTKGIDFSKYKTYAWLATKDTAYTKLVNKKNVEHALAREAIAELSQRGMVLDTVNPDCLFTYTLVMNKTYQVGQTPPEVYGQQYVNPVAPSVYYYAPDYIAPAYSGHLSVATFRDGSLVIDMIDKKDNKIIWRSSVQAKTDERDLKGVKATAKEIVPAMFKKFPKPKV